jgi:outer membrane protein TolC
MANKLEIFKGYALAYHLLESLFDQTPTVKRTQMHMLRRKGKGASNMSNPVCGRFVRMSAMSAHPIIMGIIMVSCATTNETAAKRAIDRHSGSFPDPSSQQDDADTGDVSVADGRLESYIAYAMKNSPELEALFERWQAGIHRISSARRLPDPVVSYAYFIRSVETRVGPQRHRLSLKQSFPWPTKLSAGANAMSSEAMALEKRFDARAIAIASAVEEKYWTIWGLKAERQIHEEHIEILKGLSKSAEALLMTGRIDLADQQQIDLNTARVEDLVHAIDEKVASAEAALKGLIGAPQSMATPVTSSPQRTDISIDEKRLAEDVKAHPYLQSFERLAESETYAAKRERASRFPSFTLGLDWIETGDTAMPNVEESGKDAVLIGVGLSMPVWQSNYSETISAYEAESRAYRADKAAAKDKAEALFYAVLSDLRDAKRRIDLYRNTLIPQAESVYESVVGTYVSGKGTIASLLIAERDLLDLRVELSKIDTAFAKGWAALSNVVGHPVLSMSPQDKEREGDK